MHSIITMTERGPKTNSFHSYLDSETPNDNNLMAKFLKGEQEVQSARNVVLYTSLLNKKNDQNNGITGLLVVTNFKLTFLSNKSDQNIAYRENLFLGPNDVTLQNIDCIYQIVDRKKRPISHNSKISSKLEGIQVICKNFRSLHFGFKQSDVGKGKLIVEALMRFVFPNQHNLLFAYKFSEKYYRTRQYNLFNKIDDWKYELERCGASKWRVFSLDRDYDHCIPPGTLPMHFVIPREISEADYFKLANCFRNHRTAIWVYSVGNASLVRMAELLPTITDTRQENTILEIVRKCDPLMRQPFILELGKLLPSIQDVQISFTKLRDLCTPYTMREFMQQDRHFYSLLEKTCWLFYVSLCIKYADQSATKLRDGETVVLQENDGRDMCCVISSLTQILLDPYFRTKNGFETLIQKDWISMGHPFSDRLGHTLNGNTIERSPLFLLFLDCIWQMLQQFPDEFEFSEIFLTTVWDSTFMPMFDTFLFNSEHERQNAVKEYNLQLRPVWDWGEQFTDKDLALFNNPLYNKPAEVSNNARRSMAVLPPNAIPLPGIQRKNARFSLNVFASPSRMENPQIRYIKPNYELRDLDVWMQCYYRWLPVLELKCGGNIQIDIFNRMILSNISKLQQDLQLRTIDNNSPASSSTVDNLIQNKPSVNSFFPFSQNANDSNELIDVFTASHEMLMDGSIFDGLSVQQD